MASAARSGLVFLPWQPGGVLRSTPGCILSAASRLQNRQSPGMSPSCRPQMQETGTRPLGGATSSRAASPCSAAGPPFGGGARRPRRAEQLDGNGFVAVLCRHFPGHLSCHG